MQSARMQWVWDIEAEEDLGELMDSSVAMGGEGRKKRTLVEDRQQVAE